MNSTGISAILKEGMLPGNYYVGIRMLEMKSVSKWYGPSTFSNSKVLDRVDLELKRGDFLYVLCGSGAGKSSLLKLLATEDFPSDGDLKLFGYSLGSAKTQTLRTIRQAIGYIPQNIRLIGDLTVAENVALSLSLSGREGAKLGGRAQGKAQVESILDRLGVLAHKNRKARELSGGEAQRVAVARALVRNPEVVIADEPTGAQDRDHTWAMMDLFLKLNLSGTAVIIATHDREIVRRVRKRCAQMSGGRLMMEDSLCFY
jgi:cell division transport system ATP-binding protein